jgi:hypothetical protein
MGHPFEGNQYTSARVMNDELRPATNLHLQHTDKAEPDDVAGQHEIAATLHRGMSGALRRLAQHSIDKFRPVTSSALRHAAELHTTAAQAHENAATAVSENGIGQKSVDAAYGASRASREATRAANDVLDMADSTGLSGTNPSFTKGAQVGHTFEGNQWTGRGKPPIGSRVRVGVGAGLSSGKTGTVINPREIKTNERNIPDVGAGHYKPVDWNRQVAIRYDNGDLDTMYHQYLNPA